jgi:hypothetical protein
LRPGHTSGSLEKGFEADAQVGTDLLAIEPGRLIQEQHPEGKPLGEGAKSVGVTGSALITLPPHSPPRFLLISVQLSLFETQQVEQPTPFRHSVCSTRFGQFTFASSTPVTFNTGPPRIVFQNRDVSCTTHQSVNVTAPGIVSGAVVS